MYSMSCVVAFVVIAVYFIDDGKKLFDPLEQNK